MSKGVRGQLIYRQLTEQDGLQETALAFSSLEELFNLVISTQAPLLVDRIVIEGQDDHAKHRTMSFVFRSVQLDS